MRRRIVPAAVLFFIVVAARAQPRGAVDWVFLIDTSKSMRGIGGKNIFPELIDGNTLTQIDRGILETLVKRYDTIT